MLIHEHNSPVWCGRGMPVRLWRGFDELDRVECQEHGFEYDDSPESDT